MSDVGRLGEIGAALYSPGVPMDRIVMQAGEATTFGARRAQAVA